MGKIGVLWFQVILSLFCFSFFSSFGMGFFFFFFFFTLQSPNLALGLTLEWRSSSTLSADIVVSFSTTNTSLLSKECTVNVHHSDTFGLYKSRRCYYFY